MANEELRKNASAGQGSEVNRRDAAVMRESNLAKRLAKRRETVQRLRRLPAAHRAGNTARHPGVASIAVRRASALGLQFRGVVSGRGGWTP